MASNVVFMYVVALSDSGVQVQRLHPGGEVCQLLLHVGLQVGGQSTWLIVLYGRLGSKVSTLRIGFFFTVFWHCLSCMNAATSIVQKSNLNVSDV